VTDSRAALHTPIQSYTGQATRASKSRVTTEAWWFSSTGSRPAVSSLSENAETWKAVEADS
jgi:hypothetical protein